MNASDRSTFIRQYDTDGVLQWTVERSLELGAHRDDSTFRIEGRSLTVADDGSLYLTGYASTDTSPEATAVFFASSVCLP